MLTSCQFDPSGQFDPHDESQFKLAASIGTSDIQTNHSKNS